MFAELGAGNGRADPESAGFGHDVAHAVNMLDVDDQVGFDQTGPQLHQHIRAAGKNARQAAFRL